MIQHSKIKKIGFNLNSKQVEKGYTISTIVSETQTRTFCKTEWKKRVPIPGHRHLATLPIGYEAS